MQVCIKMTYDKYVQKYVLKNVNMYIYIMYLFSTINNNETVLNMQRNIDETQTFKI